MQDKKNRNIKLLTESDLQHISKSTITDEEQEVMSVLILSAKELMVATPNKNNWDEIQKKIKPLIKEDETITNHLTVVPFYLKFISLAASVLCISMGWLAWNNFQLQNQLEQVLTMNRILEQQILHGSSNSLIYSQTMQQIRFIEQDLVNVGSADMQFNLLFKRKKLMENIILIQKGEINEYL